MNQLTKSKNSGLLNQVGLILISLVAGCLIVETAISKPIPPSKRSPATRPPTPTSADTNNFSGTVERYLLNPDGLVDGLILNNGLQVKFPPHMADRLRTTVKPGDQVKVAGKPGIPSQFGQEIRAYSITNSKTAQTVVDRPPAYPAPPSAEASYETLSTTGTVRHWLVGRKGEIKGMVLSSGAQVKFPPHVGYQLGNLAQTEMKIQAQGFGSRNRNGTILEATGLVVNGQTISIQAPFSNKPLPPH